MAQYDLIEQDEPQEIETSNFQDTPEGSAIANLLLKTATAPKWGSVPEPGPGAVAQYEPRTALGEFINTRHNERLARDAALTPEEREMRTLQRAQLVNSFAAPIVGALTTILSKGKIAPSDAMYEGAMNNQQQMAKRMGELRERAPVAKYQRDIADLDLSSPEDQSKALNAAARNLGPDELMRYLERMASNKSGGSGQRYAPSYIVKQQAWDDIRNMPEDTPEDMAAKKQAIDDYNAVYATSGYYSTTPEYIGARGKIAAVTGEAGAKGRARGEAEMADVTAATEAKVAGARSAGSESGRNKAEREAGKPIYSADQYKAGTFASRMTQAEQQMEGLMGGGFDPTELGSSILNAWDAGWVNGIKNPEQRQFVQAVRDFIAATLRRESGAAIAQSEFEDAYRRYMPGFRDDPETLNAKKRSRDITRSGFIAESGGAYDEVRNMFKAILRDEAPAGNIPTVTTADQFNALPSGAQYYEIDDTTGKKTLYRKP